MVFLTSDTHFFHKNIIEYCDRPFRTLDGHADVNVMHEVLIKNWNTLVDDGDTVYHLGDFGLGPKAAMQCILEQLNGYKVLVLGNHDRSRTSMLAAGFDEVYTKPIFFGGLALSHAPLVRTASWAINLHGHVHERWKFKDNAWVNVGVDQWDFRPITLDDIGIDERDFKLPSRGTSVTETD